MTPAARTAPSQFAHISRAAAASGSRLNSAPYEDARPQGIASFMSESAMASGQLNRSIATRRRLHDYQHVMAACKPLIDKNVNNPPFLGV